MSLVSERFLEEIRRSHTVYAYVEVTSPEQETIRVPVTDGSVSVDRTAAIRRSCQVTCIDPLRLLVPHDKDSMLTPYGTELRPYRGVKYVDGTVEVVPLGVFRIAKATVEDGGQTPQIKIESFDRSRAVARDKFTSPYVIEPGTNVVDAIKAILARTYSELDYDAISTTTTTSAAKVYDVGDDPWEEATLLATSMGCELYFDVEGRVVIAPSPDIDALPTPDFTYIEGQGCTMTELTRVFTDEPGFNGVVVTGESPGDELPPVRGEAWDEEPTSATYRFGPYGEVPMFHTDQVVKTTEEAANVARQLLNSMLGFSSQLSITSTVNPALEAGDVVEVGRAISHVSDIYLVDSFSVPLDKGGTQTLTLRQKRGV